MSSFLKLWGWINSIPGLVSALYTALKSGLLVCSGVILENDRETREQNAQTIKQLNESLAVGNDLNSLSKPAVIAALKQRGQLRDLPGVSSQRKPKG